MTKPGDLPATKKITELQSNLDRVKAENNDLYNKIADLTEVLKSKIISKNRITSSWSMKIIDSNNSI